MHNPSVPYIVALLAGALSVACDAPPAPTGVAPDASNTRVADPGKSAAAERSAGECKVTPVRSDALDNPGKHAWDLFIALNHPAVDEAVERGKPDCSLPLGQPGKTAVWETWRNARTEVFLENGSEPLDWNDNSLPDEIPGQVQLDMRMAADIKPGTDERRAMQAVSFHDLASSVMDLRFDPEGGVFKDEGAFGETRMNRATYDFIKENCLWSRNGLQRYAAAIFAGKKPPITFPVDSIEIKAAWLDLQGKSVPAEKQKTYYTAKYGGKPYGLISLHIITKDTPNWFWATFHHKDAPENKFEDPNAPPPPDLVKGTIWENYELGGTQTDFVSPTGKPSILSDHYVEFGFQKSSCITCHAFATAARDEGTPLNGLAAVCLLNGSLPEIGFSAEVCKEFIGEHLYRPGTDDLWRDVGTPIPERFLKDGEPFYVQTDFLWSMPIRTRAETAKPPDRCIW